MADVAAAMAGAAPLHAEAHSAESQSAAGLEPPLEGDEDMHDNLETLQPKPKTTAQPATAVAGSAPMEPATAGNSASPEEEDSAYRLGECAARSGSVVTAVQCDKSNGHVYISCSNGDLLLFDFHSARELWRRPVTLPDGAALSISALAVLHTQLAIGGSAGDTVIYDLERFEVTQHWTQHTGKVSALAWVGESQVYSTAHDGFFLVRDAAAQGRVLHSFSSCSCALSCMALESPQVVWLGAWDGQVKKLDLGAKQVSVVIKVHETKESPVRAICLAPAMPQKKKGKKSASEEEKSWLLFVSHGIGEICSWDLRSGKKLVDSYLGCHDVVNSLIVWNGHLYACGDDRAIRVWRVDSCSPLDWLGGHTGGVLAMAVAGITPVKTPEMEEEEAEALAASQRASARKSARNGSAASAKAPAAPAQGQGNELLLSAGFDGQVRAYRLAAIESAMHIRGLKAEEARAAAFEAYAASKTKPKKKGSRKGSAKGKKKKAGDGKSGTKAKGAKASKKKGSTKKKSTAKAK